MTEIPSPQPAPTKHTPGPWAASMWTDDVAGAVGWSIGAGDPSYLVPTNTFEGDEEEAEANARLMATAPELLTALLEERRLRLLGQEPDVHWESLRDERRACYSATDAAIAKATGSDA